MRLTTRTDRHTRATACPSLKTAWRLERRLRAARIWIETRVNRPYVGDVLVRTDCGDLRIVPSGAVRRVRA